ncbi:MAG: SpoIIE family protein phosphatase [Lentisphaerae bacterium]|nr:SpoIIE family protein phosphatase [Lentisphaerota bacterium]
MSTTLNLPVDLEKSEVRVLLVDDQPMIGEAVRRLLLPQTDIRFRFCSDPADAMRQALEFTPTVILQDLVMPGIDGLTMVNNYRAQPATKDVPLIMLSTREEPAIKAEAFARGANDYLVKLPDVVELVARIRHHSRGYINLQQRNAAHQALLASQQALAAELAEAAAYVQSLLPVPWEQGPIQANWRFIPSAQLGGDAFGYHQLDEQHYSFYLLDVCGHGVGAALLSISAMNVLRARSLPDTDFHDPGRTLSALNEAFLMEKHTGTTYRNASCQIAPGDSLFMLSDGVYEITRQDDTMWTFQEFVEFMQTAATQHRPEIDDLIQQVHALHGSDTLEDDFSIVKIIFQ